MKRKKIIIVAFSILIAVFLLVFFCNNLVKKSAQKYLYNQTSDIPATKVALLLGTSKTLKNGYQNLYFSYRIQAAVELYKAGKIQKIIVSGDNGRSSYDEPTDMKNELVKNNIDSNNIILDYAGFRTFDSMYRLKEIFSQDTVIVISQKFHNERAIYIGQKLGMQVYGFNAKDVNKYYGIKTTLREYLARVKMLIDFISDKKPKFLGEKIRID